MTDIAAGGKHSLALRSDGRVIGWGGNGYGQANPPEMLTGVVAIAAGFDHSLALRNNGTVVGWGYTGFGLGNMPPYLTNVVAIDGGTFHSLALNADGSLDGWGSNRYGEAIPPAWVTDLIAVSAGSFQSLGLKADGSVVSWGDYGAGWQNDPAGLANVVAAVAGGYHRLALLWDGTVVAWGTDNSGQTDVPVGLTNIVAIDAGREHSVALRADGTVVAWGLNDHGQTTPPTNLSNVVAIAAGDYHTLALLGNGSPVLPRRIPRRSASTGETVAFNALAAGAPPLTYQWQFEGDDLAAETAPHLVLTNVQLSQAGAYTVTIGNSLGTTSGLVAFLSVRQAPPEIVYSPAAKTAWVGSEISFRARAEGSSPVRYQWRLNEVDIPGATNPILALANVRLDQAGFYSVRARNAFGEVTSLPARLQVRNLVGWGSNGSRETVVPDWVTNVTAIAAGYAHNVAVLPDGTVVAWEGYGQTNSAPALSQAVAVEAGSYFNLALRSDGTIAGWGGTDPALLDIPPGLSDITAIATGTRHALAVRSNGTVVAWGNNDHGQTEVPANAVEIVDVAAGWDFTVALRADGTVTAWGNDAYDQSTVPIGLNQVIAVAARSRKGIALQSDGTVMAWGVGWKAGAVLPGLSNVVAIAAGYEHVAALGADGNVVVWGGSDGHRQKSVPGGLTTAIAVAAGEYHTFALTGNGAPTVVTPGRRRVGYTGEHIILNACTVGTPPLRYQWSFNGSLLPDATNALLTIANLDWEEAGTYTVTVSNSQGTTTNAIPFEVREMPPEFVRQPESQRLYSGSTMTLESRAVGSQPLEYQWFFDGAELEGATNAFLNLERVGFQDIGSYAVQVRNSLGSLTSTVVAITIPPAFAWGSYADGVSVEDCMGSAFVPTNLTGTVVELTGGYYHSLALLADGNVRAWGWSCDGQDGTNVPPGLTNVVAIASGPNHNLALRSDGTVAAWGQGRYSIPYAAWGLSNVVGIAASYPFNLAVKSDGTVAAWGQGSSGRPPPGLADVVAVSSRFRYYQRNLALKRDGTVVGWPDYNEPPPGLTNVVAIATGEANLALKSDGTVTAWGANSSATNVPPDLTNVVAIAAGPGHNLALRADGTVVAWDEEGYDLAGIPPDLTSLTAIGSGWYHGMAALGPDRLVRLNDFEMARFLWRSGGDRPWFAQSETTYDGGAAAQSGGISDGRESRLYTTVAGPGVLTFRWRISSEEGHDFLRLLVSGSEWDRQSGEVEWETKVYLIPDGLHKLEWIYSKDLEGSWGADAAWLDRVQFLPRGTLEPRILVQPLPQTVWEGLPATLEVHISAVEPWHLQWRFNGINVPGATNESFIIPAVRPGDAGLYSVEVTNGFRTVLSLEALLVVTNAVPRPVIVLTTSFVRLGQPIELRSSLLAGGGPPDYQWQFNGTNIPEATNASLVLPSARFHEAGSYTLQAKNALGSATSPPAQLIVVPFVASGRNEEGQTNWGPVVKNAIAIAANYDFNVALRSDGTVIAWPDPPPPLSNIVALAAGLSSFCLALRDDGTVTGWGRNDHGQIDVPPGLTNVVAIAGGYYHALALKEDGTVIGWGRGYDGATSIPAALSNVISVAAGYAHSVTLRRDGTVVTWGDRSFVPADLTQVVAIAAGSFHTLALHADGTVTSWGSNGYGEAETPPGLSNVVAVAAGGWHSIALKADGSIVTWGDNGSGQLNSLSVISNAIAVAGGYFHSLALLAEHTEPLPPRLIPEVLGVRYEAQRFEVRVPSARGRIYTLKFKDSLNNTDWIPLPMVLGDGKEILLSDPSAIVPHRFYVVTQP